MASQSAISGKQAGAYNGIPPNLMQAIILTYENADWAKLQAALRKSTLRNEDVLRIIHS